MINVNIQKYTQPRYALIWKIFKLKYHNYYLIEIKYS